MRGRRYPFCGTFLTPCEVGKPATSQGTVRITDHPALWSSDFPPPNHPTQAKWIEERPPVLLRLSSFPEISGKPKKSLITPIRQDSADRNRKICVIILGNLCNQGSLFYFFSSFPFCFAIFLWIASFARRSASRFSPRGMDSISKDEKALRFSNTSLWRPFKPGSFTR